jgi:hypothetical protein
MYMFFQITEKHIDHEIQVTTMLDFVPKTFHKETLQQSLVLEILKQLS